MKIIVFSDTHGYTEYARNVLKRIGEYADMVFHLGDYDADARELADLFPMLAFHWVKGNNDYGGDTPSERMVSAEGVRFLLTHGHRQGVHNGVLNLAYRAQEMDADVVLYGHTHRAVSVHRGALMMVNPGSISAPRDSTVPTFAILAVENGYVECAIMEYHREDMFLRRR